MVRWGDGGRNFWWFHRKVENRIFDQNYEFDNFGSILATDGRNFENLVENPWSKFLLRIENSTISGRSWPPMAEISTIRCHNRLEIVEFSILDRNWDHEFSTRSSKFLPSAALQAQWIEVFWATKWSGTIIFTDFSNCASLHHLHNLHFSVSNSPKNSIRKVPKKYLSKESCFFRKLPFLSGRDGCSLVKRVWNR